VLKRPLDEQSSHRLRDWLKASLDRDFVDVRFAPASNGFSAETLFATLVPADGQPTQEVVLRIEQPGGHIFLDTDIEVQASTIRALAKRGVPVPRLLALEADTSVIGRRFMVMSHVRGRGFPQAPNYYANGWVLELDPARRARLWHNALSLLGRINRLRPTDGFEFLDRPHYGAAGIDQYLGWLRAWRDEALGGAPNPVIDTALAYLEANRPRATATSLIWGDSNPCNILFRDDLTVAAALDFEAAALGPGEVDLGWWFFLDRTRRAGRAPLEGVPDRQHCIAIYEQAVGRPAVAVDYFEILGGVRMALVIASTASRLVAAGQLPAKTAVAIDNPMTATVAKLIHIEPPTPGEDFRDFVRAVAGV
jgi:aminoglycoside phosphotransferase (APT) family kinase protein